MVDPEAATGTRVPDASERGISVGRGHTSAGGERVAAEMGLRRVYGAAVVECGVPGPANIKSFR